MNEDTSDVERCMYSTSCLSVKAIAMIFRSEEHIMDSTTEPDCTIRASPAETWYCLPLTEAVSCPRTMTTAAVNESL